MRRSQRGIARLVEALLAVVIVSLAVVVSYSLAPPPNPKTVRREGDVDRVAYDVLARLAEGNALSSQFYIKASTSQLYISSAGVSLLIVSLNAIIPALNAYNLTMYEIQNDPISRLDMLAPMSVSSDGGFTVSVLTSPITNSPNNQFITATGYVAQAEYLQSLPNGRIVLFVLQLAPQTAL